MSTGPSGADALLTVREVAEELRLSRQTVRQWIRDAKLPAIRAGERKYLVRRSDLRRVIASADGTTDAANLADPRFDAPTPADRDGDHWDLAAHARPPR